jgi:hypothetical protein
MSLLPLAEHSSLFIISFSFFLSFAATLMKGDLKKPAKRTESLLSQLPINEMSASDRGSALQRSP